MCGGTFPKKLKFLLLVPGVQWKHDLVTASEQIIDKFITSTSTDPHINVMKVVVQSHMYLYKLDGANNNIAQYCSIN